MKRVIFYVWMMDASAKADRKFTNQLMRMELLLPEREALLIQQIQKGGKEGERARKTLWEHYSRLAIKIGKSQKGYGLPVNDIVAAANVGIGHAIDKYDPAKGSFANYASMWARAYAVNHVIENWSIVRVAKGARTKGLFLRLRSSIETMEREARLVGAEFDELAAVRAVAAKYSVSARDAERVLVSLRKPDASIDAPLPGDPSGERSLADIIADEAETPEDRLLNSERRMQLSEVRHCVAALPPRQRRIVMARFFAEELGQEISSFDDLAEEFGICRERVRQLLADSVARMHVQLRHLAPTNASLDKPARVITQRASRTRRKA